MRVSTLALLPFFFALGCLPLELAETNSTGHLHVTGDESWDTAIAGIGLTRVSGTNAPACSARMFDIVSKFAVEDNANYKFSLSVGPNARLAGYVTGEQAQATPSTAVVGGSFGTYTGVKRTS